MWLSLCQSTNGQRLTRHTCIQAAYIYFAPTSCGSLSSSPPQFPVQYQKPLSPCCLQIKTIKTYSTLMQSTEYSSAAIVSTQSRRAPSRAIYSDTKSIEPEGKLYCLVYP